MDYKVKKVYNAAMNDDTFIEEIKDADNDRRPTYFSSDLDKHLFAMAYYGWLVGKHGSINWDENL